MGIFHKFGGWRAYLFAYFWFAYFLVCLCVCYVTACFFSYSFIFVVASSGREGCVLSSFCVVLFLLSFPWGKGYFILHVRRFQF